MGMIGGSDSGNQPAASTRKTVLMTIHWNQHMNRPMPRRISDFLCRPVEKASPLLVSEPHPEAMDTPITVPITTATTGLHQSAQPTPALELIR